MDPVLVFTIRRELKTLENNNVRLKTIGDISSLPVKCQNELLDAIEETKNNSGLILILALNYSGRWELTQAAKKIAKDVESGKLKADDVNSFELESNLLTSSFPDPELLIRTSGEMRISNFLLWQLAYTELYFTDKLWPDFRRVDLHDALKAYEKRERRFGKISEQIEN